MCNGPRIGYDFMTTTSEFGQDTGEILSFAYHKKRSDTLLRVTYTTNLRVHSYSGAAEWFVLIDGAPCSSPAVINGNLASHGGNTHIPGIVTGFCRATSSGNIDLGPHTITVNVRPVIGHINPNTYTGWKSTSTLFVEEYCPNFAED